MCARLIAAAVGMIGAALLTQSCMFADVREQQAAIDAICTVQGQAQSQHAEPKPLLVILARRAADPSGNDRWDIVDHFVLEQPGRWHFYAAEGDYRVLAFADLDANLIYRAGEPYVATDSAQPIKCRSGSRFTDIVLNIPVESPPLESELDIVALQGRSANEQAHRTLGQLTAMGEVVALTDPRFRLEIGKDSVWRPLDAIFAVHPGVYFLEPFDPDKIPVLFVHGNGGAPVQFKYLIDRLDHKRFQAWVYSYPSGMHLSSIADHLTHTMVELHVRYRVDRFAVIAHSMGGLVARRYLQQYAIDARDAKVPLFVTMSTPWAGHKAAATGVKQAPSVVHAWRDLSPGSDFLRELEVTPLPEGTEHHLIYTFNQGADNAIESGDGTVTAASQLSAYAQREAVRVHAIDDTHVGVLRNADASQLLNELLGRYFVREVSGTSCRGRSSTGSRAKSAAGSGCVKAGRARADQ